MGLYKMYKRYGGLAQLQPLSEEEQLYDDTCRAIDLAEEKIKSFPLSLFIAGEFLWFSWFSNKTFFFPKQAQLDEQLKAVTYLLEQLQRRQSQSAKAGKPQPANDSPEER